MTLDPEQVTIGEIYNPWRRFIGAFIPNWLLERAEVTSGAKLCFARLAQYAGRDGICHPNLDTLAAQIGASRRQTDRYIAELKRFGLIKAARMGLGRTNRYAFLWHAWIEEFETSNVKTRGTRTSAKRTDAGM